MFKEDYWKEKLKRQELRAKSLLGIPNKALMFLQGAYSHPKELQITSQEKHTRPMKERIQRRIRHAQKVFQSHRGFTFVEFYIALLFIFLLVVLGLWVTGHI